MRRAVDFLGGPDPSAGAEFIKKLAIPQGMLPVPDAYSTANTSTTMSLQSASFRRNNKTEAFDQLYGTPALARWASAEDELLKNLFGPSDPDTKLLPSPAEVYYRYWKYPVTGALMIALGFVARSSTCRNLSCFMFTSRLCLPAGTRAQCSMSCLRRLLALHLAEPWFLRRA
jgi:hypothetical protein